MAKYYRPETEQWEEMQEPVPNPDYKPPRDWRRLKVAAVLLGPLVFFLVIFRDSPKGIADTVEAALACWGVSLVFIVVLALPWAGKRRR